MASLRVSVTFPTLLFLFLLSLLIVEAHTSRKLMSNTEQEGQNISHLFRDGEFEDPTMYMFFKINDLKEGTKLPIYFNKNDLRKVPPLLTRQEADLIPFSESKLDFLLNHFSISKDSPQGKAMKETLQRCDFKAIEGEYKFCGTSLESMLDLAKKTIASTLQELSVLVAPEKRYHRVFVAFL